MNIVKIYAVFDRIVTRQVEQVYEVGGRLVRLL